MTGPGVWPVRVRLARSSVALLVADARAAAEAWLGCADVVLTGVHGSRGAAAAAIRRATGRYPGAAVALAWAGDGVVFAGTRSAVVGEFPGPRIAELGVQPPGFGAVLAGVLEVVVPGLQLGERGEDFGGVERRIERADHFQGVE